MPQLEVLHLGRRRQVERAPRISLLPQQRHHRLLCHRSKVVMFTPRFPAIVLPLGGPGEATRKAPEVDIQLVLPSFGWGRDGELLRVGRGLQALSLLAALPFACQPPLRCGGAARIPGARHEEKQRSERSNRRRRSHALWLKHPPRPRRRRLIRPPR